MSHQVVESHSEVLQRSWQVTFGDLLMLLLCLLLWILVKPLGDPEKLPRNRAVNGIALALPLSYEFSSKDFDRDSAALSNDVWREKIAAITGRNDSDVVYWIEVCEGAASGSEEQSWWLILQRSEALRSQFLDAGIADSQLVRRVHRGICHGASIANEVVTRIDIRRKDNG